MCETASRAAGRHLETQRERYLQALSAELRGRGLESTLHTDGVWPRLRVHGTDDAFGLDRAAFEDNVIAAPSPDGTWWFHWPWAERIAPADRLADAADQVMEALGPWEDDDDAVQGTQRSVPLIASNSSAIAAASGSSGVEKDSSR